MKEIFKRHPRYRASPEEFGSLPDDLWERCPRCRELLYTKELEQTGRVCSKCKFRFHLTSRERIDLTLDPDTFEERDAGMCSRDPLHFRSLGESYGEKLSQYAAQAGTDEAFVYGTGAIEGHEIVLGVTEFKFAGASMGAVFGEKVARAIELAESRATALVIVSNGGGARMQEGTISLLQMAKTIAALDRFRSSGLPYISVMVDPCLGGITASYAMLGDVNLAEPGAYIGFAGRRVIEQTMRQKLPADAATAEFLLHHGMVDAVVPRTDLRNVLARLVRMYVEVNRSAREKRLVAHHA
jgi:acetyl-CoA carboxylase carboxyl transferase subunit beta